MPPIGVDAMVLSARTVLVSWSMSVEPGSVSVSGSVYTLRYRARTVRHARYHYVNVTTTRARLHQLRPHTEYEISVKVSRGSQHSTWSMTLLVSTTQAGKLRRTGFAGKITVCERPQKLSLIHI